MNNLMKPENKIYFYILVGIFVIIVLFLIITAIGLFANGNSEPALQSSIGFCTANI